MSAVRLRRLQSDFERLSEMARRHPRVAIVQSVGEPPDRYQLCLTVKSLRKKGDDFEFPSEHLIEITLPASYPRTPPLCRMLTPVFHPNIAPHAICIGDHWSPGETLPALVVRIAEMLAFQSYNTKSPLNGEAVRWVEYNLARLPLDGACMTLEETTAAPGAAAVAGDEAATPDPRLVRPATSPDPAPQASGVELSCGVCGSVLRVRAGSGPVRVSCPRCRELTLFDPAQGGSP